VGDYSQAVREKKMIRALVIGSMLLFAQAVPAFAETVTLACSAGPDLIIFYLTINSDAKTVEMSNSYGHGYGNYPARITDGSVSWMMKQHYTGAGVDTWVTFYPVYNRNTAILSGGPDFNGAVVPCKLAPKVY
jgi:hypothetical protein